MYPGNAIKTIKTKPAGRGTGHRLIAWNGILLHIPHAWDARVSGQRHLIFEKDFQPQLQIRWEKSNHRTPRDLQKKLSQFSGQLGTAIQQDRFPEKLQRLKDIFGLVTCYQEESGMITGGLCLCADCHTLVLFQLLSADPALLEEVCDCLATLSCHTPSEGPSEILWRIQDFSITVPASFVLQNYTFGAGLTRLSFYSADLLLQTCTLGPADSRLSQQSLREILVTLTDSPNLEIAAGEDDNSCEGYRSPTIPKQVLFRLHREKPFISSKIWHDTVSNRILAVILSSNRPIPLTTTHKICRQYEIVQKKNNL